MTYNIFAIPSITGVATVGVLGLLYVAYLWALPQRRLIQGIPYNKNSVKSILGDVPSMMKAAKETKEVLLWFQQQCVDLDSPIVQVFVRPLGQPAVVISDFREAQDVLMRRIKDFDRSTFFKDVFVGVIPNHHIVMDTDKKYKNRKKTLGDTMTPTFLSEVAAPQIYGAVLEMVQLWRFKANLSQGHPFEAPEDIKRVALDAIWAAAFASSMDTTKSQVDLLSTISRLEDMPSSKDVAVDFPTAPTPAAFQTIMGLTESFNPLLSSPAPRYHHWFIRQTPSYRKVEAHKEVFISEQMSIAQERYERLINNNQHPECAIDYMYLREARTAQKEGREPAFDTPSHRDEIFGYLIAGHETTSTTLCWAMKLLADNPKATDHLRSVLYSSLANPLETTSAVPPLPTAEAIARTHMPYFDAVIEEIIRLGGTASMLSRRAVRDTEILGFAIPKGTDVFMMNNGPSFLSPPLHINENDRSEGARKATDGRGSWDVDDMTVFQPERWLRRGEKGELVFDALAGPNLQFGLGPRACFGKRLAYLEMRILIAMVVWNFRFLNCGPEYSTYAADDQLTHHPAKCFVRLEAL